MTCRVEDMMDPLVIGEFYDVPGVVVPPRWNGLDYHTNRISAGWWPILGPVHDDAMWLNVPQPHVHIDPRFIAPCKLSARVLATPLCLAGIVRGQLYHHTALVFERRRCQCVRAMLTWPWDSSADAFPLGYLGMERAFAGSVLKACKVCPHKGLPLGSLPAVDGVITCPGHGLRWSATTGRLVRRWPELATCRDDAAEDVKTGQSEGGDVENPDQDAKETRG